MPRFYGETMNIVPEQNQSLEDAMIIQNSSIDTASVDFSYDSLSDEYKKIVDSVMDEFDEDKV